MLQQLELIITDRRNTLIQLIEFLVRKPHKI